MFVGVYFSMNLIIERFENIFRVINQEMFDFMTQCRDCYCFCLCFDHYVKLCLPTVLGCSAFVTDLNIYPTCFPVLFVSFMDFRTFTAVNAMFILLQGFYAGHTLVLCNTHWF